ncbi:MAG: DUF1178 family protein [Pseudomonadota bacterium]|nr:DUF1178 family protein [Pseudomonadota bacterium]MEC9104716.1 DUF1178 family protein [Pseudomonadota bacterium]
MIQFSLKCDNDHRFDSWFKSSAAFDDLQARGHVNCAICGSPRVEKAMMAPRVSTRDTTTGHDQDRDRPKPAADRPLSAPASAAEQALADLRRRIEAESDYVGDRFVEEARRIHDGDSDARAIHGEARLEDARQLIEDGIPVTPLPFLTNRKAN